MRRAVQALLVFLLAGCGAGSNSGGSDVETFTVARGSLQVTLTESGTLEARHKVNIRPKIKTGAKILSLVDEGILVKEGDVLVELDKDTVEKDIERLEDRVIQLEADLKNARTELDIQKGTNESDTERAKLSLEFAKLEIERYEQGDHPQQLRDRKLRLDQAKDNYEKIPELLREGFVTRIEAEEKKLAYESAQLELELFQKYTHPMALRQKQADVTEAEREYQRVIARAQARLESKLAVVRQKERQYEAAIQKLEEAKAELEHLTIRAPQDGIVIYGGRQDRYGNVEETVKVGETAFPGRTLIELPDLTQMDVKLQVHQADVRKLGKGQLATISLPGVRSKTYIGKISEIGSIAKSTSWRDPVRRFDVKIELDDRVEGLRAGVTVEVEIDLGDLENILYVPLQTVSSAAGRYTVYLRNGGDAVKRRVTLGRANDLYVEVLSGLLEGDEVLLVNPEVVVEEEEPEGGRSRPAGVSKPGTPGGRPSRTPGSGRPDSGRSGGK